MRSILLVEDDPRLSAAMVTALENAGYTVTTVATLVAAVRLLAEPEEAPDALLLDIRLEQEAGIELVRRLSAAGRLPPTVVVSGAASLSETVEALRLGVFDFIEKPVSKERLLQSVHNALEHHRLRRRVEDLEQQVDSDRELLGTSPAMRDVRQQIARAAATAARVLVLGESGTGKELVAELIHRHGPRRGGPFVKLNCAAVPAALVEAELFGHVRNPRHGLFEEAHGGTLFIDEVGDLDLQVQARLLRVLEDGRLSPVGGSEAHEVDVRIVAATHRDLEGAARAGRFLRDLLARLGQFPIALPPLRERREDVPLLFRHFLATLSARHRLRPKGVDEDIFGPLLGYGWPGNVRELRNVCERLVVLGTDPLTADQLPADVFRSGPVTEGGWLDVDRLTDGDVVPLGQLKPECEREYIEVVLQRVGWNVGSAARALGVLRGDLQARVASLGIPRPEPFETPEPGPEEP